MSSAPGYDLVIFDCDGVLIDSELLSCNALIGCLRQHAIEIDLDTAFERFLGRSTRTVSDYCASFDRILPQEFYIELDGAIRAAFAAALKPIPGALTVLQSLRTPYCVASSSALERMEYSLQLTGLSPLVAGRLFSGEMVKRGKPAPDLFLYAAAEMSVAPERALVVEDSVSGVEAGKAAGMTVWAFIGGSHYNGRDVRTLLLAAGADWVCDRMADFHDRQARLFDRAIQ